MNLLRQHRKDIQREVSKHVVLKYTPHLSFHSDDSIAEGDRVLHLIDDLEAEHPEWKDSSDADEQTDTR